MSIRNAYHGTVKASAELMLSSQEVIFSISNSPTDTDYYNLWLGDGFYLFEYDFYAFKWMARKLVRYSESPAIDKFRDKYCILKVLIDIEKDRIFDLNNLVHRTVFDKILTWLMKQDPPNRGLNKEHFSDGLIINILFNELNYSKNYDMVVSMFPINKDNYNNFAQLRSGPLLQKQYCIKNKDVIREISQLDFDGSINDYIDIWKVLFPSTKPFGKVTESIYTIDRGLSYEP
jgi:hypothetical protein